MYEEYLVHYGVLGMKWRKRKHEKELEKQKKKEEYLKSPEGQYKFYKQQVEAYKKQKKKEKKEKKLKMKTQKLQGYLKLTGHVNKSLAFLKKYGAKKIH